MCRALGSGAENGTELATTDRLLSAPAGGPDSNCGVNAALLPITGTPNRSCWLTAATEAVCAGVVLSAIAFTRGSAAKFATTPRISDPAVTLVARNVRW